jgi:hypothetical protein
MDILTKAILVKLSIRQFNPKRQDAKTTREVLVEKQAKSSAGAWIKNLVDPRTLEAITSTAMGARQKHYFLSLPWQDEGWRILPVTMYQKYQDTLRDCKKSFEGQVEKFLLKYPEYIQEARTALNGMFNPLDYPPVQIIRSKFGFTIDFAPLPAGSDFRVTLANDELATIQADVDKRVQEATEQAVKDLWHRLADPVKHMVTKLSDSDAIFRDSLIENVKEIVALIPALNLTADPKLAQIARECEELTAYEPEDLRGKKAIRQEAADRAVELLKKMEGYL